MHHRHDLTLAGGVSTFTLSHDHDHAAEGHTHDVTTDGSRAIITRLPGSMFHIHHDETGHVTANHAHLGGDELRHVHPPEMSLVEAVERIIPLGSNGVIDQLWGICRRAGEHRMADTITTLSNDVRAALYHAKQAAE